MNVVKIDSQKYLNGLRPDESQSQLGWYSSNLGAIARIRRGASPRPIDSPQWFSEEGPGWVRISDVTEAKGRLTKTTQKLSYQGVERSVPVHPGDVLMSICATIGEPVSVEMEACIHDGFVVFDQFEETLNKRFLLHLLRSLTKSFKNQGQTGTQANLNTEIVKKALVNIPISIYEQSRIAAVLDTLDATIEKSEALISKLKQVRAGMLHDLLTCGVDENGRIRDPEYAQEQFVTSQIGFIPNTWKLERLSSLCIHIGSGSTPRGGQDVYKTSGIMFIRSQNVTFEGLLIDNVVYISDEINAAMKHSEIFPNDVLFNITGASILDFGLFKPPPRVDPARHPSHGKIIPTGRCRFWS